MSKYSQKVERQAAIVNKQEKQAKADAKIQAKIEEELKKERRGKKKQRNALRTEMNMVMDNLARIDALDKKVREEEERRLTPLRQRRQEYLKSLGSGDIKIIQSAYETLYGYIVGEQMERQDKEKKEEQKRKQEQGTSRDETR